MVLLCIFSNNDIICVQYVMNRILLTICIFIVSSLMVNGQSNKTFEDELFTFEYPASFKPNVIKNSPGMKLKLVSSSYGLSISYMETGWDEIISIWDDRISEQFNKNYSGRGHIVNMEKVTIQTKDEMYHCLKIMTNTQEQKQGTTFNLRNLSYMMLHKRNLFIVSFISEGKYTKNSSTEYPEKIMKGFKFKSSSNEIDFDKYLINVIKKLNAQCPIQIDLCTTHVQVLLSGNTVIIKTVTEDACDALVDYDEFKRKMCENFSTALDKPFIQYLDRKGYTIMYMIYNEYDRLKKKVIISGQDILYYYK